MGDLGRFLIMRDGFTRDKLAFNRVTFNFDHKK